MSDPVERRLLELEDYRAITELKARYCKGCDGGWDGPSHDYGELIRLFTDDAVWDGSPTLPVARGREEILALMQSFRDRFPFIVHNVMNPIIAIEGDQATGHWHAVLHYQLEGGAGTSYATYDDSFMRGADGWLIQSLRVLGFAHVHFRDGDARPRFLRRPPGGGEGTVR